MIFLYQTKSFLFSSYVRNRLIIGTLKLKMITDPTGYYRKLIFHCFQWRKEREKILLNKSIHIRWSIQWIRRKSFDILKLKRSISYLRENKIYNNFCWYIIRNRFQFILDYNYLLTL